MEIEVICIDRNKAIEKAKQAKRNGGVGSKSCGISRVSKDSLNKTLDKLRKLIDIMER